ncbi:hypothetical protein GCM10011586_23760 [Silvibacterium dinghuense]|nr:hypothetical protein GCM10011586_23760 [Silvibacterium dinghuense]
MEADWDALIGPDEPAIVAPWEGFADLRLHPEAAHTLPETAAWPELAEALLTLHAPASPVFTSKCDLWPLASEDIDPYEFDATPDHAAYGIAAYIDIVPAHAAVHTSFPATEQLVRALVEDLRRQTLAHPGRVDCVLRPADIDNGPGFAFTLYTAACGATESSARAHWKAVLHAAVLATIRAAIAAVNNRDAANAGA